MSRWRAFSSFSNYKHCHSEAGGLPHVALARYKNAESKSLSLEHTRLGEIWTLHFCSACSSRKKNHPQGSYVLKNSSSQLRLQGLEPWTP